MKKYRGEIGLLCAAMIWGGGFVATKLALDTNLTPFAITACRFLLGFLLLLIFSAGKLRGINRRMVAHGGLLGFLLFAAFTFQTVGLSFTTASKNAFLTAIDVVFVPLIGWLFFHEKLDFYGIAGALLAFLGAGSLMLGGGFSVNVGDFLTLVCALCFAFHIYCVGLFVPECDATLLTMLQFAFAFLFSAPLSLLFRARATAFQPESVLAILYLGVFSTGIAFLLQNVSQKLTSSTRAAILLSSESVFGSLMSVLFLHERPALRVVVGCLLILAAVLLVETKPAFSRPALHKKNEGVQGMSRHSGSGNGIH